MTTVRNRVTNSRSKTIMLLLKMMKKIQNDEEDKVVFCEMLHTDSRKSLTSSVVSWCGNRNMMALLPLARDLRSHVAVCVLSSPGSGRVVRTQTLTD